MKPAVVYDRWEMMLPDHIADWDVLSYWEQPRTDSIAANLKWGDILIDVGAEHGWLSALFARYVVGGDAMILVEPSPELWRNVRLTWEANDLAMPWACAWAFADRQSGPPTTPAPVTFDWPEPAVLSDEECPAMAYRTLGDPGAIPSLSIDTLATATLPDGTIGDHRRLALNIDIEGAELRALHGAERVIEEHRPLVWVSIHDDLVRGFGDDPADIHALFRDLGYLGRHLGTDHEQHWLFYDPTRRVTL